MDTVSLDIRKSAPNHVSVAEEKLFPIMVERTRTTPFVECKWSDGEFFAYEFLAYVAENGGFVGLFLGYSVLQLRDFIGYLFDDHRINLLNI